MMINILKFTQIVFHQEYTLSKKHYSQLVLNLLYELISKNL